MTVTISQPYYSTCDSNLKSAGESNTAWLRDLNTVSEDVQILIKRPFTYLHLFFYTDVPHYSIGQSVGELGGHNKNDGKLTFFSINNFCGYSLSLGLIFSLIFFLYLQCNFNSLLLLVAKVNDKQ